ncbi:LacI family DNA-binding transcriptional regulator [Sandaracinobacteroides saxicola]|uniref:LacI family DNA-binding transcriptional regulator n=1 Tax=Sandaracinobacteroides saxicola TaxID=2759707 RepID=A0A7G5IFM0_9SPHN|nr:LacI family DNA-binding transcriptional regulator [Sandaracinobacteroides saxicola]QMW22162.1 LacI family DNA-binding transcriptional regulator [Sandaracinobacteroides saxicola]
MAKERLTSFDIAYLAGVSQPTVSRALRGSASVSEQTRKRILAIAKQHNYTVDRHASSLRTQRSNTLALLFFEDPTDDDTMINPFFLAMLGSITRAAADRGHDLLISFQSQDSDWHAAYRDSRRADGIILLGYGDYTEYAPKLARLEAQDTPFVLWGLPPGHEAVGTAIGSDNVQGGHVATRHLLERGRRRIAFLGSVSAGCPEFQARFDGHAAALAEHDLGIEPALMADARSIEEDGRVAMRAILSRGVAFDAVFAVSDLIALGAIHTLQEAGLRVPEDVAVVGFDDIPSAALGSPPLTTVAQDVRTAGTALVEALLARIAGQKVESRLLPTRLVVRKSSG